MKLIRHSAAAACLAASLAVSLAAGASAADAPDAPAQGAPGHMGPQGGPGNDMGGHAPGVPGPDMPLTHPGAPHLRGLHLTEAQEDRLFALQHAQAPQRREHEKAIRKAHEGLRELAKADKFDDAKAQALTRELGNAVAAEALATARLHAQVLAVLTPEQREQLRQQRAPGLGADGDRGLGGRDGHDAGRDGAERR
jgi:Spy/CpxP family protein refolding chaperone